MLLSPAEQLSLDNLSMQQLQVYNITKHITFGIAHLYKSVSNAQSVCYM